MPSAWSLIDASFPTFTGEERVREQCTVMLNYMYMLAEGLKYQLSNLNAQNFNSTALKDIQLETTADVEKQIEEMLADLNTIKNNISAINSRLTEFSGWKDTTTKQLSEIDQTLQTLSDTQKTQGKNIEALKDVMAPDGSGGATLGKDGVTLNLVGKVYINGTLIE